MIILTVSILSSITARIPSVSLFSERMREMSLEKELRSEMTCDLISSYPFTFACAHVLRRVEINFLVSLAEGCDIFL